MRQQRQQQRQGVKMQALHPMLLPGMLAGMHGRKLVHVATLVMIAAAAAANMTDT
jgi:hypothetical protein